MSELIQWLGCSRANKRPPSNVPSRSSSVGQTFLESVLERRTIIRQSANSAESAPRDYAAISRYNLPIRGMNAIGYRAHRVFVLTNGSYRHGQYSQSKSAVFVPRSSRVSDEVSPIFHLCDGILRGTRAYESVRMRCRICCISYVEHFDFCLLMKNLSAEKCTKYSWNMVLMGVNNSLCV